MPDVRHSQFNLKRHYAHPPAQVFAAWASPEAKQAWFVGHDGPDWRTQHYSLDFRVGGRERGAFLHGGRVLHENETTYLDIEPDARIVFSYTMALDGVRHSAALATVLISQDGTGATLRYTEQGAYFAGTDGTGNRKSGWKALLAALRAELDGESLPLAPN